MNNPELSTHSTLPHSFLSEYGFDPTTESETLLRFDAEKRAGYLRANLESYVNEVIRDEPVSLLYHYWINADGEIFTDPSESEPYRLSRQCSPHERGGLYMRGITGAVSRAVDSPYHMIGLYSPPGPAAFDRSAENPFSQITYTYGQLYLLTYDGNMVNAVALKLNGDGNVWAQRMANDHQYHIQNQHILLPDLQTDDHMIASISRTIQTAIPFGEYEHALTYFSTLPIVLYTKHDGTPVLATDIAEDIRREFSGKRKTDALTPINSYDELHNRSAWTKENIAESYLSLLYAYGLETGKKTLTLSGSCGGSTVEIAEIENLLGIDQTILKNPFEQFVSSFGSDIRSITQTDGTYEFNPGKCRKCGRQTEVGPCHICHECEKTIQQAAHNADNQ